MKAAAKKAPAKKAAAKKPDVPCAFCGRKAVARNSNGTPICATHKARAEALERPVSKL